MPSESNLNVVLGSGPLGRAVMKELLARGKTVKLVNRSGKGSFPTSVALTAADIYDPANVRDACQGAAVVYLCAAPNYAHWPDQFPPLARAVVTGLSGSGSKLVFGDNLYMYGEVSGPIHENLPHAATTRKGRTRAQVADLLMEAHASGKVSVAIGRGSDFFGPYVTGSMMGERTFRPILAGKAAEGAGNIDLPHTYTFIEDFGKALVVLGENPEAFGQVWHVPNAETLTTRQFITLAFEIAGLPVRISRLSRAKLLVASLFVPDAREMVEMLYEFEKPFVVDSSKFARAFGVSATPLREAIANTLAWYRGIN